MKKYLVLFVPFILFANGPKIPSINDIMSIEDQKATGVIRLTQEQKKALAQWLVKNGYYEYVAEENFNNVTKISINIDNGAKLILSDNTVWEVAPDDQVLASSWLSAIPVKLSPSSSNEYPFFLTNLNTNTSIKVKKSSI